MPKDRRSTSFDRHRVSPYSRRNEHASSRRCKSPIGNEEDWEAARCPICIEHPHNAVLLLCSSRQKGCIPYMCNTSSRHSNCLDQFHKSSEQGKFVCPLCRGKIGGWAVVDPARQLMNSKTRSCSVENCRFTGNYAQLRQHARREHPYARPTEVNPEREREWTRLGEEREQRDLLRMQFESDEVDNGFVEDFMNGVFELATPNWNYDLDFESSISPSDFSSFSSVFDSDSEDESRFLDDFDFENIFAPPSLHVELESRDSSRSRHARIESESSRPRGSQVEVQSTESSRPRGTSRSQNLLFTRPSENTPATTRRRGNDRSRQWTGARHR